MQNAIFLSGKISGYTKEEYTKIFKEWENYWVKKGYTVYNPVTLCERYAALFEYLNKTDEEIWIKCMEICIRKITCVDTVFFMEGWEKSEGSRTENYIAKKLKKKIIYGVDVNGE